MQHTLVAVFDNRSDAQNAMDELLASGFTRSEVKVSSADPTGQTDSLTGESAHVNELHEEGLAATIKHFFTGLFGADNDIHASRYSDVVSRGHHVLTLVTASEPEVERAADIIERFGPVDLDERHDLHGSAASLDPAMLAAGASAGSGLQRASPMSQQSDAYREPSYGSGSLSREHGGRNPFATQDLNDPVPKGQTYQEPMGDSWLPGASLQGTSSMPGSTDASLGGTIQTGSMQAAAASPTTDAPATAKRGVKVYSRPSNADDERAFRSDWERNYASEGGSYEEYEPAYRYGNRMRNEARYQGRHWDEAEPELRSEWDARYGEDGMSTWDRMKAAVRHGWNRLMH